MKQMEKRWEQTIEAIKVRHPELEVKLKSEDRLSKLINKIMFWRNYMTASTTTYPKILMSDRRMGWAPTLQHEWVHYEDEVTFFGLFKRLPKKLNTFLFYMAYAFPQNLCVLALLAPLHPMFLLALLSLLPLPAPLRMIAEIRAFRRTVELGGNVDNIVNMFADSSYWFMWPFKRHVRKLLKKPSPYKELMDKAWE